MGAAPHTPQSLLPPSAAALRPLYVRLLTLLILFLTAAATVRADTDLNLTVRARHCLAEDVELGPLNLGVSVRNGTATVWGTVPNAAAVRHALDLLYRIPGIKDVRNELTPLVSAPGVPAPRPKRPRLDKVVRDDTGKPKSIPAIHVGRPVPDVILLKPEPVPTRHPVQLNPTARGSADR